jgi:hypothetical protein
MPEIKSAHNGDAVRRGSAAEECPRRLDGLGVGASPWPATGVFGRRCSTAGHKCYSYRGVMRRGERIETMLKMARELAGHGTECK